MSKYFSNANENKKSEKIEINNDGINVNCEKKIMYFLLAIEPLTFILFFIEFLVSLKINQKNNNNKTILVSNNKLRFFSLSWIKLLSINVKKVIKPTDNVKKNMIVIKKFLFKKANIK